MGAYSALILATSGLVAYWRLGESSGNVADSKGVNTGVPVNTIGAYSVAGALVGDANTAITFPGGGPGYFTAGTDSSLNLADVFTLEAWVKVDAAGVGTIRTILSKENTAYYLRVNASNQLELVKSQVAIVVASTTTITADGSYHHVAATKNGASVQLYIDGNDVTGAVTNAQFADNANALLIGTEQGAVQWWVGQLDEIALYTTELTSTQITAHHNAGLGIFITPTSALANGLLNGGFQRLAGGL